MLPGVDPLCNLVTEVIRRWLRPTRSPPRLAGEFDPLHATSHHPAALYQVGIYYSRSQPAFAYADEPAALIKTH